MPEIYIRAPASSAAQAFPEWVPPDQQPAPAPAAPAPTAPPLNAANAFPDWSPTEPARSQSVDALQKAIEPITSYPETYRQMREAAQQQMATGAGQIAEGFRYATQPTPEGPGITGSEGIVPLFKGLGNVGAGAAEYAFSPISAGLRTVIGKPLEENVGIPKEYSEFAASLAVPGLGMTKMPNVARTIAEVPAIRSAADLGYDAVRGSNVVINPDAAGVLANTIENRLIEAGYRPIANTPGQGVFSIVDELRNPLSNRQVIGPDLSVRTASTPADLEAVRKALNVAGADPKSRDAVRIATKAIDDFYRALPQVPGAVVSGDASKVATTIEQARANARAAIKSEQVTGVEEAAGLRTAATHSGQNYDNAVRQRFATILSNPKMRRGFTPDELAQMEKIVRGNVVGNISRRIGNLLGGGGGLGQAVASGMGAYAGGPVGAGVVSFLGTALKKVENLSQARNVAKLDEMIRAAAPATLDARTNARIRFAADKWARAQTAAGNAPTAVRLAQLEAAQRGLSLMLNRSLGLDAQNVFRSLQQLTPTRASDQQNRQ